MMLRALKGMLFLLVSATLFQVQLATPLLAEDDLLDPEIAFRFSASLTSNNSLEVHFRIADGYYMYRDAYRFSVQPDSIALGEPQFPPGQWHVDEFLGRSEVYRNEVTIRLPIQTALRSRQAIRLVTVSQGCADIGVCYLPTTRIADFASLGLPGGTNRDQ
jgi:thiol:disulfide interchange protein DsbD